MHWRPWSRECNCRRASLKPWPAAKVGYFEPKHLATSDQLLNAAIAGEKFRPCFERVGGRTP